MARIITRISASIQDTVVDLDNEQLGRPIDIGSNWNRIRIGMRWAISGSGQVSTPRWYVGMSAGTGSMIAASSSIFLGLEWENAGSGVSLNDYGTYYANLGGAGWKLVTKINSVESNNGQNALGTCYVGTVPYRRSYAILEITKGTPNYTVGMVMPKAAGFTDTSLNQLTASIMSPSLVGAPGLSNGIFHSQSIAYSDSSGSLDTINVYWGTNSHALEISEIIYVKME